MRDGLMDAKRPLYKQEGRCGLFQVALPYLACVPQMQPHLPLSWGEGVGFIRDSYLVAYFYEENLERVAAAADAAQKRGDMQKWRSEWAAIDLELTAVAKEIADAELSSLSLPALRALYDRTYRLDEQMWALSIFIDAFDSGYDQREIERISREHGLSVDEAHILTTPDEPSFVSVWEQMLVDRKAGTVTTGAIRERFFWNGTNYSAFAEVDDAYVSAAAEKAHGGTVVRNQDQVERVLSAHALTENPLAFYRMLTAWRDERKRLNHMGLYALLRVMREAGSRHGISHDLVDGLLPHQADAFFAGSLAAETLRAQKHDGVLFSIPAVGDIGYRFGTEACALWQKNVAAIATQTMGDGALRGTVASRGLVRGVARVLADFDDPRASSFQNGDILVTSMTRPEFLPLMKLAAAFVTDEGGITSHAAIVAREMKKPCIIGTKVATQVLKDGDLVEVDAEKGIVTRTHNV